MRQRWAHLLTRFSTAALVVVPFALTASPALAQNQQQPNPEGRSLRRSPPQPQQKQGLDFLAGTWRFTWTGRESDITSGPRTGTAVITRQAGANTASMQVDGTSDLGGAYKETGSFTWDEAKKALTIEERLASGAVVKGVGDWSSPIGISFESAPLQAKGKSYRVRRTYSILGPASFSITEELSTDGGAWQRLGRGDFLRN